METCEGLSNGGRPSTPRPFVGPFTLRAVGTANKHTCNFTIKLSIFIPNYLQMAQAACRHIFQML